MCRIKFKETFGMNVGVPNLSKKIYLSKTVFFKKFKNKRSHKKSEEIRAKSETKHLNEHLIIYQMIYNLIFNLKKYI
jgi:DNA topoisomerase IB